MEDPEQLKSFSVDFYKFTWYNHNPVWGRESKPGVSIVGNYNSCCKFAMAESLQREVIDEEI